MLLPERARALMVVPVAEVSRKLCSGERLWNKSLLQMLTDSRYPHCLAS